MPTGARVEGAVPRGHYSRAELTRLQAELRARLAGELEPKARAAIKALRAEEAKNPYRKRNG